MDFFPFTFCIFLKLFNVNKNSTKRQIPDNRKKKNEKTTSSKKTCHVCGVFFFNTII